VPLFRRFVEEKVVIPFIERTWFLWWVVALIVILRWFYLFSSRADDRAIEIYRATEEQARTTSDQIA